MSPGLAGDVEWRSCGELRAVMVVVVVVVVAVVVVVVVVVGGGLGQSRRRWSRVGGWRRGAGRQRKGKRAGHGRAGLAAGSPHARFSMEKGRRRMVEEAAGWVDL